MLRVGKEDGKKKYFVLESTEKGRLPQEKTCGSHPLHGLMAIRATTIRALAERTVVVVRGVQPPRNEKHTDLSITG